MALLTARHATGRERIVVFAHGYHGGPLYFGQAAAAAAAVRLGRPALQRHCRRRRPHLPRTATGSPACWSSRCSARAAASPASRTFSRTLREATARRGAVLIFDEVMTSRLARRRRPGAARRRAGSHDARQVPRRRAVLRCLRRPPELMAAYDPVACGALTHGGTFNNNAFTMAVGAAVHESLIDAASLSAVNERGDRLRTGLNARFESSPLPFTATGWGSLMAIHPVPGPSRRRPTLPTPIPVAPPAVPRSARGRLLSRSPRLSGAHDGRLRRRHRAPARGGRGLLHPSGAADRMTAKNPSR